ncbi:MAG TPA: DUF4112 domain-containing protein [Polyangiaceae bacterium]
MHARPMTESSPRTTELSSRDRDVALAVRLAHWLDDRYLDPVIGLILPEIGDLAMAAVGLYPVFVAIRHRMPAIVVARMIRNLAIDLFIGAIPVIGDLFDFVYKAHRKNADLLLERHVVGPSSTRDWMAVLGALVVLLVALAIPLMLAIFLFSRLSP